MAWYKIEETLTGRWFPQIVTFETGANQITTQYIHGFDLFGRLQDDFQAPIYKLRSAKATDILSTAFQHNSLLLISEKLKNILSNSNHLGHQVFDAQVKHKNQILNYFIFYIPFISNDFIDFSNSKFCLANYAEKKQDIDIESKEEYEEQRLMYGRGSSISVTFEKLVLVEDIPLDLFRLQETTISGYFVNDSIKETIESSKCTGIKLRLVEDLKLIRTI